MERHSRQIQVSKYQQVRVSENYINIKNQLQEAVQIAASLNREHISSRQTREYAHEVLPGVVERRSRIYAYGIPTPLANEGSRPVWWG